MNKAVTTILIVILIIIGAFLLLSAGGDSPEMNQDQNDQTQEMTDDTPQDEPEGEDQSDAPSDWETYSNASFDFTFSHPAEAQTRVEAGRAKVQLIGPESVPNTEVTDGFTFYVRMQDPQDMTLQEYAQSRFTEETERLQAVEEPHQITIDGRSAYEFQTESELSGTITFVVMESSVDAVYDISYMIAGPESRNYEETITQMMGTLSAE